MGTSIKTWNVNTSKNVSDSPSSKNMFQFLLSAAMYSLTPITYLFNQVATTQYVTV